MALPTPTKPATAPDFIGIEALEHIADKYESQIVMGASYFNPAEMTRLGFKVFSGVQFRNTKTLFVRKGGTTRRKVVGTPLNSKLGFLKERVLVARLTWNHYKDNRDSYVETPIPVEGSADFSYPLSELAFQAAVATYGEDLYANLFFGDIENGEEGMDLMDGVHTCIKKDIADGLISKSVGNLIDCDLIEVPDDTADFSAWTAVENWILAWNGGLKRQPKVLLYCSSMTGVAIQNAYANKWHGNDGVTVLENGNFKVKEYPRIEFVPSDDWGQGDLLCATVPGNFEYGVNSEDSRTKIRVKEGSDVDLEDITIQVQSIQGVRVMNILPSVFALSTGGIAPMVVQGDYKKSSYTALSSDEELGTVAVSPSPSESGEYAIGTTLTITATPTAAGEFVKWSDGVETNPRTHRTNGLPEAIVAIFEAKE